MMTDPQADDRQGAAGAGDRRTADAGSDRVDRDRDGAMAGRRGASAPQRSAAARAADRGGVSRRSRNGPATKLKGDVLRSRGGYQPRPRKVAAALTDYQAAFEIYRAIDDTRSQAIALLSIAALVSGGERLCIGAEILQPGARYLSRRPAAAGRDVQQSRRRAEGAGALCRGRSAIPRRAEARARLDSAVLQAQVLRNLAWTQLRAGKLDAADQTIAEGFRLPARRRQRGIDAPVLGGRGAGRVATGQARSGARRMIERAFAGGERRPNRRWSGGRRTRPPSISTRSWAIRPRAGPSRSAQEARRQ